MTGGLTETTGWTVDQVRERDRQHVEAVLAQGGFARVVEIAKGVVVWVGPDGGPWKHIPQAPVVPKVERKLADRSARLAASRALAEERRARQTARRKAEREAAREARAAAKAAAKLEAERRRNRVTRRRPSWQTELRSGPALKPSDLRRARAVLNDVAQRHGLDLSDMLAEGRRRALAHARFEAMWLLRELRGRDGRRLFSLPRIGRVFGRDHTSVHHGLRRHAQLNGLTVEPELEVEPATEWSRAA